MRAELEALRAVCAQAYQLAGAVAAPERVLDVLAAAADGRPLPHDGEFLPIAADDCGEVRALRDHLVVRIFKAHADDQGFLSLDAWKTAALELGASDAPLSAHLVALGDHLDQPATEDAVMTAVRDWMHSRRR